MKTFGELNYLAQKYGWRKEPLSRAKINRMTADESAWNSLVQPEEFNRAWNEDKVKAENGQAASWPMKLVIIFLIWRDSLQKRRTLLFQERCAGSFPAILMCSQVEMKFALSVSHRT